jgi:hypothetical protein
MSDNITQTNYLVILPDGMYLKDYHGTGTTTWDVTQVCTYLYEYNAHRIADKFLGARVAKRTITVEIVEQ